MEQVEQLASSIVDRLQRGDVEFLGPGPTAARYAVVDDLFPTDVAERLHGVFPEVDQLRRLSSIRERKYTSKALDRFDPVVAAVTFAFQQEQVIREIEVLTGLRDIRADPMLYAGGVSAMTAGDFLEPHIDNSHDVDRRDHRVLNLLYYCTPNWSADDGGCLELWDEDVASRTTIPPLFNRLVVMATHPTSWHSVSRVTGDRIRTCVSNYYFSPHPPAEGAASHVTYFRGRPEDRVKRALLRGDSSLRTALRKVHAAGLGRRDVYRGAEPDQDR